VHSVMIFGAGDVGTRMAEALLLRGQIRQLIMVDLPGGRGAESVEMLASCHLAPIHFEGINALNPAEVEQIVRRYKPDLVIQAASLRSPFAIMMADHPIAHTLHEAGMAVQLGYQFPLVYSIMQGVKTAAPDTPVANVSFPDLSHYLLDIEGLAPTAGLANTGIIQMRVESNLLRDRLQKGLDKNIPKVRVIGGHAHVYGVLFGQKPADVNDEPLVYLGEESERAGDVVYTGANLETCPNPNMTTAMGALPVVEALLPGADDCYTSMPGPLAMRGGYPVRIRNQKIELDLPNGVTVADAEHFNMKSMAIDGIESVDADGTVHYTEKAKAAMAGLEPRLTEPYNPLTDKDRTSILLELVDSIR
jgi:hypothetical protein